MERVAQRLFCLSGVTFKDVVRGHTGRYRVEACVRDWLVLISDDYNDWYTTEKEN